MSSLGFSPLKWACVLGLSGCAGLPKAAPLHRGPADGSGAKLVVRNASMTPFRMTVDGGIVVFNPGARESLSADTGVHPQALGEDEERILHVSTGAHVLGFSALGQLSIPHQETLAAADGDVFAVTMESGTSGLRMKPRIERAGDSPAPAGDDVFTTLEKLKGLRDRGIITEEEFASKKQELLRKIQ